MKKIQVLSCALAVLFMLICLPRCSSHKVVKRYKGAQAERYLKGRLWIDRFPQDRKQPFLVYYFDDSEPLGIHIRAYSTYKRLSEYFSFASDSDRLSFTFLHDERKADSRYIIEEIKPEGRFNLKLTLVNDPQEKGKKCEYFSNTAWSNKDAFMVKDELMNFHRSRN
jgi:hypothetical protein